MQRLSAIIGPHAPFMASVQAQRRRLIEELIICIVLPLLMIPVLYCVQGHRYDIVENIGPVFPTVATWLSVLVQRLIPLLISIVSLFYGGEYLARPLGPLLQMPTTDTSPRNDPLWH